MNAVHQPVNDQRRVAKKRNRPHVSCGHCRIRKSRCNRSKPCESCVRSGDATTCSYDSNRSNPSSDHKLRSDQPSRDELVSRIDRLEQLVMSAMPNQQQSTLLSKKPPQFETMHSGNTGVSTPYQGNTKTQEAESDHEIDQLSTAFGVMKVDPAHVTYLGGAHWVSVMSEIREFRNFLDNNHEEIEHVALSNEASARMNSTSLLRGTSPPKTLDQLLPYIPARPIADRLIARYFDYNTSRWPIIHEKTFRRQYNEHWQDPTKTKLPWLAVLFGVLNHAIISYKVIEDASAVLELGAGGGYKNQAIDCLVAADFATIEGMILYIQAEWITSQDTSIETSIIIGMMIRLAMRMGIHRDSRAHPELTPFRGEMRRRIWASICIMDTLYSWQISLPAVIQRVHYDCELPRNIFDHEFDENTTELPPSRPLTDHTEVSYLIIKARMSFVSQGILSLTESNEAISVEDVTKYEQDLDEVWRTVPSHFRIGSLDDLNTISLRLKSMCINLDRTYQMAQCILHRKFIRPDPAFIQYRRLCIDAAMTLLSHQATLYLDCDSTSSIYPQNSWKRHFATLTTHDFFIACMAIALDLHYGFEVQQFGPRPDDITLWGYDRRSDMITALEISTEFWRVSREESIEAAKAHGMFSFVLEKVKKAQLLAGTSLTGNETTNNFDQTLSQGPLDLKDPELPLDFDLNMWNSWRRDNE